MKRSMVFGCGFAAFMAACAGANSPEVADGTSRSAEGPDRASERGPSADESPPVPPAPAPKCSTDGSDAVAAGTYERELPSSPSSRYGVVKLLPSCRECGRASGSKFTSLNAYDGQWHSTWGPDRKTILVTYTDINGETKPSWELDVDDESLETRPVGSSSRYPYHRLDDDRARAYDCSNNQ